MHRVRVVIIIVENGGFLLALAFGALLLVLARGEGIILELEDGFVVCGVKLERRNSRQ